MRRSSLERVLARQSDPRRALRIRDQAAQVRTRSPHHLVRIKSHQVSSNLRVKLTNYNIKARHRATKNQARLVHQAHQVTRNQVVRALAVQAARHPRNQPKIQR